MGQLFEHALFAPAPAPPRPRARRDDEQPQLPGDSTAAIWRLLAERGADPVALAALLRERVPPAERRRAYLELVRDLGVAIADGVWAVALPLERSPLPVEVRARAEAALGAPLGAVQIVGGEPVDRVASALGTPAFTIGREVFVKSGGGAPEVLLHEAVHAAQQQDAPPAATVGRTGRAAEDEAHRVLARVGPLGRERRRAATVVRAALGRAPSVTRQPQALAAFEPTPEIASAEVAAPLLGDELAHALERGATPAELEALLSVADTRAARLAVHLLGERALPDGRGARRALADTLAGSPFWAQLHRARPLPSSLRAELEPRLGVPLDGVRVHEESARARALGVAAFTSGQEIHVAGALDESRDGRRLIAHELAHVAQQTGARPAAATATSAPGSAVEREAERVAHAVTAGEAPGAPSLVVRERAPAGTLSPDTGAPPTRWPLRLFGRQLDLDLSTALDAGDGLKKLANPLSSLGPVRLDEIKLRLDGASVLEGQIQAALHDGKLAGAPSLLQVDKDGNVSGALPLALDLGALTKPLSLTLSPTSLGVEVPLAAADFSHPALPVASSSMSVRVTSTANGLDVQLLGSAKVRLDAGFADGEGTLSAKVAGGELDATVAATLRVAGLAEVGATLRWKSGALALDNLAPLSVTIPGMRGLAQLSHPNGKLHLALPDLRFIADSLKHLQVAAPSIGDGRLAGAITVGAETQIDLGLAQAKLDAASTLALDGAQVSGEAHGTFTLGAAGQSFADGKFALKYAAGAFDGTVQLHAGALPFLTGSAEAQLIGLGDKDEFRVAAALHVKIDGLFDGDLANVSYQGKLPSGDLGLSLKMPELGLPKFDFGLLSGWKLKHKSAAPAQKTTVDFGDRLFGKLGGIDLSFKWPESIDLTKLSSAFGDLSLRAPHLSLPSLGSLHFLEDLDLHLPGGGGFDWKKLFGHGRLNLKIGDKPTGVGVDAKDGKMVLQLHVEVDFAQVLPGIVVGHAVLDVDGNAEHPVKLDATNVHAADPRLGEALTISKLHIEGGVVKGAADFAGSVMLGENKLTVKSGHLEVDTGAKPGLVGTVGLAVEGQAGDAAFTFSYDAAGSLVIGGGLTLYLQNIAPTYLEGTLKAQGGSAVGLQKFSITGPKVLKEPFTEAKIDDVQYDKDNDILEAGVSLKKDPFVYRGLTITQLDAAVQVKKNKGPIDWTGHLKGDVAFVLDGVAIGQGKINTAYAGGKLNGKVALEKATLALGGATVTAHDFQIDIRDGQPVPVGKPALHAQKPGMFNIDMQAQFGNDGALQSFVADGSLEKNELVVGSTAHLQWKAGLTGSLDAELSTLGGLIDSGKTMAVEYDGTKWQGHLDEIELQTGRLAGWRFGGSFDGDQIHAHVAAPKGGSDWKFGELGLKVKPGSQLTVDGPKGLNGQVGAQVEIGGEQIMLTATFVNSKPTLHVDTKDVNISKIIPALAGTLSVSVNTDAPEPLIIDAAGVHPAAPWPEKALVISKAHYQKDKLTAAADFAATVHANGMELEVKEGHLEVDTSAKPALVGSATFAVAGGIGQALIKIAVGADGKLAVDGDLTVDLAKIAPGYLEGTLKAKGGTGGLQSFSVVGPKVVKEPFAAAVIKDPVAYQKEPEHLAAGIQLGPTRLSLPGGVDVDDAAADVNVAKDGGDAIFDGTVKGKLRLAPGGFEVGTGSIDLAYQKGRLNGTALLDKASFKIGAVDVLATDFGLKFTDGKPAPVGAPTLSATQPGLFALEMKAQFTDGALSRFGVDCVVEKTPLTEHATVKGLSWEQGQGVRGAADVELSTLDGLIDPGKHLKVSYDGTTLKASVDKFTILTGTMAGWSFAANLDGTQMHAEVAAPKGGSDWSFGELVLQVAPESKLSYDSDQGVNGKVGAHVALGTQGIAVEAEFAASKLTSLHVVAKQVEIKTLIEALKGTVSVDYDSNTKDLTIDAAGVSASDPDLTEAFVLDLFHYEKKTVHVQAHFKTDIPISIDPVSGTIQAGSVDILVGPKTKKFSGSITVDSGTADDPAIATISYTPEGKFSFAGALELDAAGLTDNNVTGRLRYDNILKRYAAKDLKFITEPLNQYVQAFSGDYQKTGKNAGDFSAEVTIAPALCNSILPDFIRVKKGITLAVKRDKSGFSVALKGDLALHVDIGEYFSGDLTIHNLVKGIDAELSIPKDGVNLPTDDFKVTGGGITIRDKKGTIKVDANAQIDVAVPSAGVKAGIAPKIEKNKLIGARITGELDETEFTQKATIAGEFGGGKTSVKATATFKDLGGLLDPGVKLAVGYDTKKGFSGSVENVHFSTGLLERFTLKKAWIDKTGWGATISGGADLEIGELTAHIKDNSTFGFASGAKGLNGRINAVLRLGELPEVKVSVEASASQISVHAATELELDKLTDGMVAGKLDLGYDGNLNKGTFSAHAPNPTLHIDDLPKGLEKIVEDVKATYTLNEGWTGSVRVRASEFDYDGAPVTIAAGTVKLLKGGKLDGMVKATVGGALPVTVDVGWKMGVFSYKVGVIFDMSEIAPEALKGRVQASVGSGGKGDLKIIDKVEGVGELKGLHVTKLSGSRTPASFKAHVEAKALLQRLVKDGGDLHIEIDKTDAEITYEKKKLGLAAVITGSASLKDVASTKHFELGYDEKKGFFGVAKDIDFDVGGGMVKGHGLTVDLQKGLVGGKGYIAFKVPGIVDGKITNITLNPFANQYAFDGVANFDKSLGELSKIGVRVQLKDGVFSAKAELKEAIDLQPIDGAHLIIDPKSTAELGSDGKFKVRLTGKTTLPADLGSGDFTIADTNTGLSGDLKLKLNQVAIFKAGTDVQIHYASGLLNSKAITLEIDEQYTQYFKAAVILQVTNNKFSVAGQVNKLINLGAIGDAFQHGTVKYDEQTKKVQGHGSFDLSKLPLLGKKSKLDFQIVDNLPKIVGDISVGDIDGVEYTNNLLKLEWSQAKGFTANGSVAGHIGKLASFEVKMATSKEAAGDGGDKTLDPNEPSFLLTGKLSADDVQKYLPDGVKITPPTAVLFLESKKDGTWDYGLQHLGCRIIAIPGVDECDMGFDASYTKGDGFGLTADVLKCKIKNFNITGSVVVAKSQFQSGNLTVTADFPGVDLVGTIDFKPSTMDKMSIIGSLTATPTGGGLASFIESGKLSFSVLGGDFKEAKGEIFLKTPSFLKAIHDPKLAIIYDGKDIIFYGTSKIDPPFGENAEPGDIIVTIGGPKKFEASISFPLEVPGMKKSLVFGIIDKDFNVRIGAEFRPNDEVGKYIRSAEVHLAYEGGDFKLGGTIVVTPTEDMELIIAFWIDMAGAFSITVMTGKPPAPDEQEQPGPSESVSPPMSMPGMLSVSINAGFSTGLKKPSFKFEKPDLKGGMGALKGGLPPISFHAEVGIGATVSLGVGIHVAVGPDLGALGKAVVGLDGELKGTLHLKLRSDVDGTFKPGEGGKIEADPYVGAALTVTAKLAAFATVEVALIGNIADKHWDIADATLAEIGLGEFHPFEPLVYIIGGPNAGFQGLQFQKDHSKIFTGVQGGLQDITDDAAHGDMKPFYRDLFTMVNNVTPGIAELPPDWQKGIDPDNPGGLEMFVIFDGPYGWMCFDPGYPDALKRLPGEAPSTPAGQLAGQIGLLYSHGGMGPSLARDMLYQWRAAQIAHMGINPVTGVDVPPERDEVQQLSDGKYAEELAAAQAKQKAESEEHAEDVQKQGSDFAAAEQNHKKTTQQNQVEYQQKTEAAQNAATEEVKKAEKAAKDAKSLGANVQLSADEKTPPPPPPSAPPPPPPLEQPAAIPAPPPVDLPKKPEAIPLVILPALPPPGANVKGIGLTPIAQPQPPPPPSKSVAAAPPPPTGVPSPAGGGSSAQSPAGGGPPPKPDGTPASELPKAGGGGGGGGSAEPPMGPHIIQVQQRTIDGRKKSLGDWKPGTVKVEAPKPKPEKGVDPTVQAVTEKGKAEEKKQAAEEAAKQAEYKKTTDEKQQKSDAAAEQAKKEADKKTQKDGAVAFGDGETHKMPAAGDFPAGTPAQARVAYANWIKLKRSGETLHAFESRWADRDCFDFDASAWTSLVSQYQVIFNATKAQDALPTPTEFAQHFYAGGKYGNGTFTTSASFDPGCAISDETIRALETIEQFKTIYKGNSAGDYLMAEAEKLPEAERNAFAASVLQPIAGTLETAHALRAALERLGPAAEVRARLALVDAGKSVAADAFWKSVTAQFDGQRPGLVQIDAAIAAVKGQESEKPKVEEPKPTPDAASAPPTMLKWKDAAPRFDALKAERAFEISAGGLYTDEELPLDFNRDMALTKKAEELAERAKKMPGAKPEEVFAAWLDQVQKIWADLDKDAKALVKSYGGLISELRAKAPRLDPDGVAEAVAAFRKRVGSNTLVLVVNELNPAGSLPEERVEPSVLSKEVDGGGWNPMLDLNWVKNVYENPNPADDAKPEAKKKDPEAAAEPKKEEPLKKEETEAKKPAALTWAEAQPRFEALEGDESLAPHLALFGVQQGGDRAGNENQLRAALRESLVQQAKQMPGAKPDAVVAAWRPMVLEREKAHSDAIKALAQRYAAIVGELRQNAPRLDGDAVSHAAAAFRKKVGSNMVLLQVPQLNPPGITAEENLSETLLQAAVAGADWNPIADHSWLQGVVKSVAESPPAGAADSAEKEKADATEKKAEAEKEKPPMKHWEDIEAGFKSQFDGYLKHEALNWLWISPFGNPAKNQLDASTERSKRLGELKKVNPGKTPSELFVMWKTEAQAQIAALQQAAKQTRASAETSIYSHRKNAPPRLDAEGIGRALGETWVSIGGGEAPKVADLNPVYTSPAPALTEGEKVPDSIAPIVSGKADWNVFLDEGWTATFLAGDPGLEKDDSEKKDEKAESTEKKPESTEKKPESAEKNPESATEPAAEAKPDAPENKPEAEKKPDSAEKPEKESPPLKQWADIEGEFKALFSKYLSHPALNWLCISPFGDPVQNQSQASAQRTKRLSTLKEANPGKTPPELFGIWKAEAAAKIAELRQMAMHYRLIGQGEIYGQRKCAPPRLDAEGIGKALGETWLNVGGGEAPKVTDVNPAMANPPLTEGEKVPEEIAPSLTREANWNVFLDEEWTSGSFLSGDAEAKSDSTEKEPDSSEKKSASTPSAAPKDESGGLDDKPGATNGKSGALDDKPGATDDKSGATDDKSAAGDSQSAEKPASEAAAQPKQETPPMKHWEDIEGEFKALFSKYLSHPALNWLWISPFGNPEANQSEASAQRTKQLSKLKEANPGKQPSEIFGMWKAEAEAKMAELRQMAMHYRLIGQGEVYGQRKCAPPRLDAEGIGKALGETWLNVGGGEAPKVTDVNPAMANPPLTEGEKVPEEIAPSLTQEANWNVFLDEEWTSGSFLAGDPAFEKENPEKQDEKPGTKTKPEPTEKEPEPAAEEKPDAPENQPAAEEKPDAPENQPAAEEKPDSAEKPEEETPPLKHWEDVEEGFKSHFSDQEMRPALQWLDIELFADPVSNQQSACARRGERLQALKEANPGKPRSEIFQMWKTQAEGHIANLKATVSLIKEKGIAPIHGYRSCPPPRLDADGIGHALGEVHQWVGGGEAPQVTDSLVNPANTTPPLTEGEKVPSEIAPITTQMIEWNIFLDEEWVTASFLNGDPNFEMDKPDAENQTDMQPELADA